MTSMSRIGLLVGVPALAVAAAWFVLRGGGPASGVDGAEGRAPEVAGQGPALEGGSGPTLRHAPRGSLAIRGQAVLSSGRPAAGARVRASIERLGEVARATVAVDGSFALEGLAKEIHRVEAVLVEGEIEHGAEAWVGAGTHDHLLTLVRRPRTLEFRVLTPAGEPVPRFDARLVLRKGLRGLGVRGEGSLKLHVGMGLTQDSVADLAGAFLEVWGARDLEDRALGLAPRRVGPLQGDERELEVRLVGGPVIEGRVIGPDGPLADPVTIKLSRPKPQGQGMASALDAMDEMLPPGMRQDPHEGKPWARPPFDGISTRSTSDAQGTFRLAFLGYEGAHSLEVDEPEGFLPHGILSVTPGDPPFTIVLRPAVTARVTVLGPDGKPREGVSVSASPIRTKTARGMDVNFERTLRSWSSEDTDEAGLATLKGLDPALHYRLHVNPSDANRRWKERLPESVRKRMGVKPEPEAGPAPPQATQRTLEDWVPADTEIRLEAAFTLSGRVLDAADRPVEDARVRLAMRDGWKHETSDAQGGFLFEGLAQGEATLLASNSRGVSMDFREPMVPEPGAPARPRPPDVVEVLVQGNVTGVIVRVPRAYTVTLRMAAEAPQPLTKPADLLRSMFGSMTVSLLQRTDGTWTSAGSEHFDAMGRLAGKEQTAQANGLEAGVHYAAWMPPVDGRYVYVEFDADVGTVTLERRAGGAVSGRVLDLPEGAPFALVALKDEQGREVEDVKTDREGRFEVLGLPPATWTVRATHRTDGGPALAAEGKVATGGTLDLRLAPEPKRGPPPWEVEPAIEEMEGALEDLGEILPVVPEEER